MGILTNILMRNKIKNVWKNLRDSNNIEELLITSTHSITDIDLLLLKKINPSIDKLAQPLKQIHPFIQNNKMKYSDFLNF